MDQTPKIEGARGVLVWAGLGNPGARGLLGAVAIGSLAYAIGQPSCCFDDEGRLRPLKCVSNAPEATNAHFLLIPIVAGGIVALVT